MSARSPGAAREQMGVSAQNNRIHLAIAVWEWPSYFDPAQRLKGIRLDLAEYRRPDPRTIPCHRQGRRPLHDLHDLQAPRGAAGLCRRADARLARPGRRGTGANIFFVRDGAHPHADADCFLDGITRRTVDRARAAARHRGDRARASCRRSCTSFTECFITGTAAEVTPVSEIADWKFKPGAITKQLMDDYTAEVQPKGKAAAA